MLKRRCEQDASPRRPATHFVRIWTSSTDELSYDYLVCEDHARELIVQAKIGRMAYAQCALPIRLPPTTNNHAEALLAIVDAAASAEIR